MWKSFNPGSNQRKIPLAVSKFWKRRNTSAIRYKTLIPNTILQTAGCGLVKGPFGKASTDIIRKKNITQVIPAW